MTKPYPRPKTRSSDSGLTLLEMIVALAVLALGIVGTLQAFSSSVMTCKAAESYSVAATLVQQVASELERRTALEPGRLSGSFPGDDSSYRWEADLTSTSHPGLFHASITVFWQTGSHTRHLQMFTCVRIPPEEQQSSSPSTPPSSPGVTP